MNVSRFSGVNCAALQPAGKKLGENTIQRKTMTPSTASTIHFGVSKEKAEVAAVGAGVGTGTFLAMNPELTAMLLSMGGAGVVILGALALLGKNNRQPPKQ